MRKISIYSVVAFLGWAPFIKVSMLSASWSIGSQAEVAFGIAGAALWAVLSIIHIARAHDAFINEPMAGVKEFYTTGKGEEGYFID